VKEITDILDGTKLANQTFRLYSTDKGDYKFGYTPWSITTWNRGDYDHYDPKNVSYLFHEISHVIHAYRNNPYNCLKVNFGYPPKNDLTKPYAAYAEVAVLAIQSVLEADNPTLVTPYDMDEVYSLLTEHHKIVLDRETFDFYFEQSKKELYPGRLYHLWGMACAFVKAYRVDDR
jgi:hypothetical protein